MTSTASEWAFAACALLLAACSTTSTPPDAGAVDAGPPVGCQIGFLGAPGTTPSMVITALWPDGVSRDVHDGDEVPLMFPPQGGRVVFAGVRVTGVEACGASLNGALRDEVSGQLRLDGRSLNLRRLGDGGFGGSVDSNQTTFANIPACPNQWASAAIPGSTLVLEMSLEDRTGRKLSQSVHVRPTCAEPANAAECACICKKDYVLGETCRDDGGI